MLWWRSWHGAPIDHKWAVIAARAGVKVGIVSALAWALFDYASQQKERGSVVGFDTETYAVFSGFEESEIVAAINAMQDKGIILDGKLANWEKRQPKREDDSAERVRRHREMKRSVTQGNTNSATETIDSVSVSDSLINLNNNVIKDESDKNFIVADVYKAYEKNIGILTPMIADKIDLAVIDYSAEWCISAIGKAVEQEKRSWAYVNGVLKGFKRDGFNNNHKAKAGAPIVSNPDGSYNV